jgi:hypothetical protein
VTEEMSNVKKYTSLSIVRHDDLVQIVLRRNRIINFNIHPKQFQQTLERFRESAVIDKGYNFLEIEKEIIKRKYIPHILHRER